MMAANAYVLLTVEPQLTDEVAARLEAIPRALVRQVLGPYDMIVELSEDTAVDVTAVVRSKIRPIPGVASTVTCLWLDGSDFHAGGE
jgi:uncharacterized membrane protein